MTGNVAKWIGCWILVKRIVGWNPAEPTNELLCHTRREQKGMVVVFFSFICCAQEAVGLSPPTVAAGNLFLFLYLSARNE